ncbi:MAG: DUF4910 domain-containing protein [Candidatus Firestonebacteria bacterium]
MEIQNVKDIISKEISRALALKEINKIYLSDRIGTNPAFNKTANYVYNRLKKIGLKDVEKVFYKADGKTLISDWRPSPAWDCKKASLKILEPKRFARTLVKFPDNLLCVAANSGPTPKEGIMGRVMLVEKVSDLNKAKGKIIFTQLKISNIRKEIVKNKVSGVISSSVFNQSNYKKGIYKDNIIYWENVWHARPNEVNFFAFKITPRDGEFLKEILKNGERLVVKAYINAKNYSGKIPTVSAVIPGKNLKEEVVVVGHLYEIGANDNASGTGLMIEIARTLNTLIKNKILDKPERSIRFLFVFECFGTLDWLMKNKNKKFMAGLNLDMIGENQSICGSTILLNVSSEEVPSFVNELIISLFEDISKEYPLIRWTTHSPSIDDGTLFSDPVIGAGTPFIYQQPDPYYHSEDDSMDKIDPNILKFIGIISATYLYFIANSKENEARWLMTIINNFWKKKIANAVKEGQTKEKIDYLLRIFNANLNSALKLVKESGESKKSKESKEDLIPKRIKFGLLAFDGISDKEKEKFLRIAGTIFPWSDYLCSMLFWIDGKKTIKEINWLLSNQYGKSDLKKLIKILKFMNEHRYIKFVNQEKKNVGKYSGSNS